MDGELVVNFSGLLMIPDNIFFCMSFAWGHKHNRKRHHQETMQHASHHHLILATDAKSVV